MNSLLIVLDSKRSLALSFLGILICLMLNQFPDISIAQVEFANGTTMLKHLLVKVLYACIIFLAIFKIGKKVLPK